MHPCTHADAVSHTYKHTPVLAPALPLPLPHAQNVLCWQQALLFQGNQLKTYSCRLDTLEPCVSEVGWRGCEV